MQISGSTVLLTGATGGIGHAIARALARARREADPDRPAQRRARAARRRARRPRARRRPERARARSSAWRREAGGRGHPRRQRRAARAPARSTRSRVEQIDRALDVNLRAPIVLAHALAPAMVARGRGHLLFISSLAGKAATPGTALYNATKFGLRGFAAALRADLHDSGVGVSAVFPGFIRDAGMFADAGVTLPPGRRHAHAGGRRARGRDGDRAQPRRDRRGAAAAAARARSSRASHPSSPRASRGGCGSEEIAREMQAGQRDKR